ncbi:MAG TPA: hypothetical protein VM432_06510 [Bdellovibrionales bacterium]|nr:hypothetical protein [Bdellovibrionales bacterium]
MISRRIQLSVLTGLCSLFMANPSHAYLSVIDTGEVINPGTYQASLEPQIILTNFEGVNAVGRFDIGLSESTSARAILGFGKVDYQIGGMYKWVPFPDVENQPAIGGEAGILLARVQGETAFTFRFSPLISKRFETEIGDVTPYGSIPVNWTTMDGETTVPLQLVGGAELTLIDMKNISYFAEIGTNIKDAFGYISAAVAWRFDEQ